MWGTLCLWRLTTQRNPIDRPKSWNDWRKRIFLSSLHQELLEKKIRHWKKGSNYLDGTNILSFWGKNLEGSDLSLMEVKTWQTPSPFHLCTQELFLMTAQNCMHLENKLSEASATVQHIHMNAQCGLVIWTGFSQEFSYTWSNQGGTRGSCVKHRNNRFTILLHHLISYCLYWS